ncbi:MAG: GspE/PulE family protein [Minisyncoccia bacterium]
MIISEEELKNLLIKNQILDEPTWEEVKKEANFLNLEPLDLLLSRRLLDKEYYANLLSEYLGVKRVNLKKIQIQPSILKLVPEQIAIEKQVIPFGIENDRLNLAMVNPKDMETITLISNLTHMQVEPYLSLPDEIQYGLTNYQALFRERYRELLEKEVSQLSKAVTTEEEQLLSASRIVDNLLTYAMGMNASDIHIEIFSDFSLIRFRIDGILREILRLPKYLHPALIARVKILSSLQLDEHFRPQDGRFKTKLGNYEFDIRVSIIPTLYGEKAELRLLAATFKPTSLEELGMNQFIQEATEKAIKKTYGIILVTGPTGCGKTTTLYTILQLLNRPEVNICTIEDPIEYELPKINQMQVNPKLGLTFATGLRALLRQDPNIIMVGEIRDYETADIAIQAALTGHLILSTLHTNDAPSAIPRLIDLNVPPYLISATLNMVLAQRLVRKICLNCVYSEEIKPHQEKAIIEQLKNIGVPEKDLKNYPIPKTIYKGKGCELCGYSGYKGRTGIFEGFFVDEELSNYLATKQFNNIEFKNILREKNFRTMFEDGLEKVTVGITTLEEVLRVIRE